MKIIFIRHGRTPGNLQSRYIGITDEELCEEGRKEIENNCKIYPEADIVFTSPMKRCIQTARIIYPYITEKFYIIDGLKEIDFGDFEGRNYNELNGSRAYQEWIDSGGKMAFPNGEDRGAFSERCLKGFASALYICSKLQYIGNLKKDASAVFIVHGGTIMSVLGKLAENQKENNGADSYFNYHCGNGNGYICRLDDGFTGTVNGKWERCLKITGEIHAGK